MATNKRFDKVRKNREEYYGLSRKLFEMVGHMKRDKFGHIDVVEAYKMLDERTLRRLRELSAALVSPPEAMVEIPKPPPADEYLRGHHLKGKQVVNYGCGPGKIKENYVVNYDKFVAVNSEPVETVPVQFSRMVMVDKQVAKDVAAYGLHIVPNYEEWVAGGHARREGNRYFIKPVAAGGIIIEGYEEDVLSTDVRYVKVPCGPYYNQYVSFPRMKFQLRQEYMRYTDARINRAVPGKSADLHWVSEIYPKIDGEIAWLRSVRGDACYYDVGGITYRGSCDWKDDVLLQFERVGGKNFLVAAMANGVRFPQYAVCLNHVLSRIQGLEGLQVSSRPVYDSGDPVPSDGIICLGGSGVVAYYYKNESSRTVDLDPKAVSLVIKELAKFGHTVRCVQQKGVWQYHIVKEYESVDGAQIYNKVIQLMPQRERRDRSTGNRLGHVLDVFHQPSAADVVRKIGDYVFKADVMARVLDGLLTVDKRLPAITTCECGQNYRVHAVGSGDWDYVCECGNNLGPFKDTFGVLVVKA